MDNGSNLEIPAIVTEDLSPTPVIHVNEPQEFVPVAFPTPSTGYSKESSDPSMLSPGILKSGRRSFDSTADEDRLSPVPPSPTLSAQSSVHFTNTTALRENKPGDGSTSLALLSPHIPNRSHSRRPSNATITSTEEGTVADHSPGVSHLYPATSDITTSARSAVETLNSPTPTHVDSTSDIGDFPERVKPHEKVRSRVTSGPQRTVGEGGDDHHDGEKAMGLDLAQDGHIDPAPFGFRPNHLASLVDRKNLDALEAFGGTISIVAGLGVNPTCGLCIGIDEKVPRPEDPPAVIVTDPSGEKGNALEQYSHEGPPFSGTVEDRQRVYGANVLPVRKTRTLLQLMWLALKDRVLVRPTRFLKLIQLPVNAHSALDSVVCCCGHLLSSWFLPGFRPGPGPRRPPG